MIDMKIINDKPSMFVPGKNVLKTLDIRKKYVLKKLEEKINNNVNYYKYSYLIQEYRALEKTMNFIQWLINNSENDIVKKVIEIYKADYELTRKIIQEKNDM